MGEWLSGTLLEPQASEMWTLQALCAPGPVWVCLSSQPNPPAGLKACVRMMSRVGLVVLEGSHEDVRQSGLRQKAKVPTAGENVQRHRSFRTPALKPACLSGDCNSRRRWAEQATGPTHQARKHKSLLFLCLLRPARVVPHLKGARSTGSWADPEPGVLINIPPPRLTLTPTGAHITIHHLLPLGLRYQPGKGNLKIKPGPECVPLDWTPALTDLLILAYLSPVIRLLTACYQPVGENVLQPD